MTALVRIFYAYLAKINRGITPQQASGETMKALSVHFPHAVAQVSDSNSGDKVSK